MEDLHKFLYAISAACFIGIGSGLLTLTPYFLDYEARAMRAGYELEQVTSSDYSKGIDCKAYPEIYANCEYASYLLETNKRVIGALKKLAYFLFFVGVLSALFGLHLHPKRKAKISLQ